MWPLHGVQPPGPWNTTYAPFQATLAVPPGTAIAAALGGDPGPRDFVRSHATLHRLFYASRVWDAMRKPGPIPNSAEVRGLLMSLVAGRAPPGVAPAPEPTAASSARLGTALHNFVVRQGATLSLRDAVSVRPAAAGAGVVVPPSVARTVAAASAARFALGSPDRLTADMVASAGAPAPAAGPSRAPPQGGSGGGAGAPAQAGAPGAAGTRRQLLRYATEAVQWAVQMTTARNRGEEVEDLTHFAATCAEWMRLLTRSLSRDSLD